MKKHILIILCLCLSSCALFIKKFPQESDIAGIWEGTGIIPYARLQYEIGKPSYLIMVNGKDGYELFQIKKFTSEEEGFVLELDSIEKNETETLYGSLTMGQIELKENRDDEYGFIWLTAQNTLKDSQKIADDVLEKLR
jgi:hypothetical protein